MVNRTYQSSLNLDGIPITTTGARPIQSPKLVLTSRAPTPSDSGPQYIIGTIWVVLNRALSSADQYEFWYLADNQSIPGALWLRFATSPSGKFVSQFTTTNDGHVAIPATALGNINLTGVGALTVTTPVNLGDTINFALSASVAESFPTDSGTAIPNSNILNIFGSVGGSGHTGDNINTSASSNTVVVHLNKALHMPYSNAAGTEGTWYTAASGSPLAGGNIFISNLGTANTFVGELAGNLTLTTASAVHNSGFGAGALDALTTGAGNTAGGYVSGASITSGTYNTLYGFQAGQSITSGTGYVAIGANSLASIASGSEVIAIGNNALTLATGGGSEAVAIGFNSQSSMTQTSSNTSVGYETLQAMDGNGSSTGYQNSVLGTRGLVSLTTGSFNTAIGSMVAGNLLTGDNNVFIGSLSDPSTFQVGGQYSGAESHNVVIQSAGVTGESNTLRIGNGAAGAGEIKQIYIGAHSGTAITTALNNVCIGNSAGASITTLGSVLSGVNPGVMIGKGAGQNETVEGCIAIGNLAFTSATGTTAATGVQDIAIGDLALTACTDSNRANVAIGQKALEQYVGTAGTDIYCTAVGWAAGNGWVSGRYNTFIGAASGGTGTMYANTGQANTAVGALSYGNNAAGAALTGSYNILLGQGSGIGFASNESSNILIQAAPGGGSGVGLSNTTVIGNGTGTGTGQQNKCFISGIRGITTANNNAIAVLVDSANQLGTVSSSIRFKENIEDMGEDSEFLYQLRPVTFNYKNRAISERSPGLIAEEVEVVAPWLVAYDSENNPESVKYHELVPLLLNELQKLNNRVAELEDQLHNGC